MRISMLGAGLMVVCAVMGMACKGDSSDEGTATETGTTPMGTTDVGPTESGMTDGTTENGTTEDGTTGPNPSDPTTEDPPTSGTETGVETGDPKLEEAYLEWQKQNGDYIAYNCQCDVDTGFYDNINDCLQNYLPTPALVNCNAEVISGFPQVEFILQCYVAAETKHVQCISTKECESGAAYDCESTYYDDFQGCGVIPPDVIAEMQNVCEGIMPFICMSGEKLPGGYQCDYEQHCMDNSDEKSCPGQYTCPSGGSIPEDYKCDGGDDCQDGSDEQGCPQYMCADGMMTISEALHCNGPADCTDKSDEKNCPDRFTCTNGDSVPLDYKCDSFNDCSDNSDEMGC